MSLQFLNQGIELTLKLQTNFFFAMYITKGTRNKKVYNHFSSLFINYKFGLLPNRSSLQQELLPLNHLLEAKKSLDQVDIIYLGFSKAFDPISHKKLLSYVLMV